MKPRVGSWWKVFLYSQLLIPTIGLANYLLDANYMFLCVAPIVENPFIFTRQWPWYILGFANVMFLMRNDTTLSKYMDRRISMSYMSAK